MLSFYTILIVPSLVFITTTDAERSPCEGFHLGETIRFRSLEFIANRFGGLSLSPPLGDSSGAIVMGPTRGEPPLLQRTMMGGPIEGPPMTPNGEGRTDIPFLERSGAEVSPTSTTTIPRSENPLADQAMMTIPPWQETPWSDDNDGAS
jgi:hypothetical protein